MKLLNGFRISKIIFILLQCFCYVKADCSLKKYEVLPRGYNIFMQTGVKSFFQAKNGTDRNKCFQWCALESFCQIWRFDNGNCHIFHSMKDKLRVEKVLAISSITTYYETEQDEEWFKMYFLKSGSGFLVSESFLGNGTYESWGPQKCTRTLCSDLFRSNLIDVWSHLPIHEVKLLARKDDKNVVSMIFDGNNTDKGSWFKMARTMESPWVDFTIENTYLKYKICSSFELCKKGHSGWFSINYAKVYCNTHSNDRPPYIWYSNTNHVMMYTDGDFADDFSIFISFK